MPKERPVSLTKSLYAPYKMPKRQRTGPIYDYASDATLRSAGGYRSLLGTVYTRDQLLAKGRSADGFVDYSNLEYPDDATNQVRLLATIAQGTSTQQRVGRKIQYKGIDLRFLIKPANDTGVEWNTVRCSIVYDKQPTSTLPSYTDIYETADVYAPRKEDGFERFTVLKEFRFTTIGNVTDGTHAVAGNVKQIRKYLKVNKEGRYKPGSAGTIGEIAVGAIYVVWIDGDVAAAGLDTTKMKIQISARTHFKDSLA